MARKAIKLAKPIKMSGTVDLKKSVDPGRMSSGSIPGMKGKINLKKMPRGRF